MRKASLIPLAALVVITFLLILPYIQGGFSWSAIELALLYGLGSIILFGYLWLMPTQKQKSKKKVNDIGETVSVTNLACYGCDFIEQREFKPRDYINKQVGKCRKCGRELYIKSIYAVEQKSEIKKVSKTMKSQTLNNHLKQAYTSPQLKPKKRTRRSSQVSF